MTPVSVNFIGIYFFPTYTDVIYLKFVRFVEFQLTVHHFFDISEFIFDSIVERHLAFLSILFYFFWPVVWVCIGIYDIQLDFHYNFFPQNKQK